jgi:hypothetical protein
MRWGHPDRVMWPASEGLKMVSLEEPLFDDTIYCIEVMERGRTKTDLK